MKVGIDPRRSSSVCNFTAALVEQNGAHGNIDRHRSMVVASRAYTVIGQFYAEVLVDVERASLGDQPLSQLEVNALPW